MIVVTGAAGFIGSNVLADLEEYARGPLAACDWFEDGNKQRNLSKRRIAALVPPEELTAYLNATAGRVRAVVHMGAISSTTERDIEKLAALNVDFSVSLWDWCADHAVPFIYASSAAVYGGREAEFHDDESPQAVAALHPLNAYGWSKRTVDEMFVKRCAGGGKMPPQWVGLRFFNVYGPNEYHKGDMMSVAAKLFDAVTRGTAPRLFRSHRAGIADGGQRRDFVHVKDCTKAVLWFLDNPGISGIFNLGTGKARSFLDVAHAVGAALGQSLEIEFVDMPEDLRDSYQYFTEADMAKARARGMTFPFATLEDGIADYVSNFLLQQDRYR